MSTRVLFTGIDEYRAELRAQPEGLAKATQTLAMRVARDAARDIRQAYPKRTDTGKRPHLRDGVVVQRGYSAGGTVASAWVANRNPLSHLFENGSQARQTKLGADRGSMPPGHVFVPRMVRWRYVFYVAVKTIMEAAGITVTGEA